MLTEERKRLKAEARARFVMPYKVDDILHHSWGYEQTNCDFYQVVEVKNKSVVLKKIKSKTVPGSEGFMSDSRLPEKGAFITDGSHALAKYSEKITPENPTIEKRVASYVKEDGSLRYFISTPYGWCELWDGTPQSCSWYA